MKKQIGVDNGTKTLEEIARSILSKMAFGILSYYRSIPFLLVLMKLLSSLLHVWGRSCKHCRPDASFEEKDGRYASIIVSGFLFGRFGLFEGIIIYIFVSASKKLIFISTIVGLSMSAFLLNALQCAFSEREFQV
ncbi:hypothetical protein J2S09_003852 [Bacillus fengqiuensis]|nr:hypothetical protein [Bacillus fengqiuensis]